MKYISLFTGILFFLVVMTQVRASEQPFISTWSIKKENEKITLPLRPGFQYNFTVDWGDESPQQQVTSYKDSDRIHIYKQRGTYTITISGLVEAWYFNNRGDKNKITSIPRLGHVGWKNFQKAFRGCQNLTTVEGGDTSQVTNMSFMFSGATLVQPKTGDWDVSNVKRMVKMFHLTNLANPNVDNWVVSKVKTMKSMFHRAASANPRVELWDVSLVRNMDLMFHNAFVANPNVTNWNTSRLSSAKFMFHGARLANPNFSNWAFSKMVKQNSLLSFVKDTAITTVNYSRLLIQLNETAPPRSRNTMDSGSVKYNFSAKGARANLVKRGWQISDGGLELPRYDEQNITDGNPKNYPNIASLSYSNKTLFIGSFVKCILAHGEEGSWIHVPVGDTYGCWGQYMRMRFDCPYLTPACQDEVDRIYSYGCPNGYVVKMTASTSEINKSCSL